MRQYDNYQMLHEILKENIDSEREEYRRKQRVKERLKTSAVLVPGAVMGGPVGMLTGMSLLHLYKAFLSKEAQSCEPFKFQSREKFYGCMRKAKERARKQAEEAYLNKKNKKNK